MTDYMQKIAMLLKTAEVPNVEILQNDEAIFEALKAHIVSLQDIAAKADTRHRAGGSPTRYGNYRLAAKGDAGMTEQEQREQLDAALAAIITASNAVVTATKIMRALPKQYGMTLTLDALDAAENELRWAREYAGGLTPQVPA